MKPTLALSLAALAVLIIIIYLGYLEVGVFGHVINPEAAQLSIVNKSLTLALTHILNLTAAGEYSEAALGIKLLNSTAVAKLIIAKQIIDLMGKVNNELMTLNQYVILAKSLLISGNYTGALGVAMEGLDMIPNTQRDISSLINALSTVSPTLASEYEVKLTNELNEYREELMNITSNKFTGTVLTIHTNSTEAYVGSNITVTGQLTTANGTPIPNATIILTINRQTVGEALTNNTGYYTAIIGIPSVYTETITITATYNPPLTSGYLPSSANTTITVLFNETVVTVLINNTVYWGFEIPITGYVSGLPGRVVQITLGNLTTVTMTNDYGWFKAVINTSGLVPGNYSLIINVQPNGTYSPATYTTLITIIGIPRTLSMAIPGIAVAGAPMTLGLGIKPSVGNETVVVMIGGQVFSEVVSGGNSTVTLTIPITLSTGYHNITITIPGNPPYMGVTGSARVLVINPIQLIVPIIIVPGALLIIRRNRRRGPVQEVGGGVEEWERLRVESSLVRLTPPARLRNPNVMGVITYTARAIAHISLRTGVAFSDKYTFREYLAMVRDKLSNDELNALSELFLIAEAALYSRNLPSPADVERARYLTTVITHEA
ncbi:MSCRAMM family protein [Vulcanisaeta thermophila]|uniref:MSCRAMM family protein n=1 Tax=Vulcanisaeta thermophila TaxID=867917 RepID=UPI0008529C98|nr:carboxypeptidase-like regulatory domain-containing protein [Vulcanisaeta thermophila]